jgi:tRNA threonylcarbamoyladenosine biosynthesis protein TsaB
MRILAIETVSTSGSVAALDGGQCRAERALPADRRSAQTLAPGIRDLLGDVDWRPADVQLVAVAIGPGSFTGLRVGVTTAKVFAYAVGAEVLGVIALVAIARQAPTGRGRLWTVIDAHRQQVYAAVFDADEQGVWHGNAETQLVDADAWLAALRPGETVAGPALTRLAARLPNGVAATPQDCWAPRAFTIGQIAAERHAVGMRDDLWRLAPLYVRPSAAEEKLAERT